MGPGRSTWVWWGWLARAQWRSAPGRSLVATLAVAVGVALALAIHLVNASALEEFRQAIASVNGEAHLQIRARAETFADTHWDQLLDAGIEGIEAASPVLEKEVEVLAPVQTPAPATRPRLRVIGLDPFAAAQVTPSLLPQAFAGGGADSALFDPDAIFLSNAALEALGLGAGERLSLRSGLRTVVLRVAGTVPGAPPGQILAVMDLGSAQWRLDALHQLSRIDLKLAEGMEATRMAQQGAPLLPADVLWTTPQAAEQRMSNLSRAYRVNLNVLAAVALFTGGFLVFATTALAVVRQQRELALLGVLGASRAERLGAVLLQGGLLGALGAVLGTVAGVGMAAGLLVAVGGDLGGGYFGGSRPALALHAGTLLGFGSLGLVVGLAGAALPAWQAARQAPARILRGGSAEDLLSRWPSGRIAFAGALLGALLLALPPIAGLPLGAYAAIACWLASGIACVSVGVRGLGRLLGRIADQRLWSRPAAWLAATRIAQSPATVAAGLAAVVCAFALTSAMALMVTSFRASVAQWLDAVLPADVYARVPGGASGSGIDAALQARLRTLPGISRVEFLRSLPLSLDAQRPAVTLLIREIDQGAASQRLPMTGASIEVPPGTLPVWVSEPLSDRYRMRVGDEIALPLALPAHTASPRFTVAGVWRDYARQHGALVIAYSDWQRLGGDAGVSDVALWLAPDTRPDTVMASLVALDPSLAALEWRSAVELRALSLRIFDRSFAVTYALEAIALIVALFGVASAAAGDALVRAAEFGMMRHVGVSRRTLLRQLAIESALAVTVAIAWGGALGAAIGLVLIKRVNPQSFHWTMEVHWPLGLMAASAALLGLAAVLSALIAARSALGAGPLLAVRQDT